MTKPTFTERITHFETLWRDLFAQIGGHDGIAELLDSSPEALLYYTEEHGSLTGVYLAAVGVEP